MICNILVSGDCVNVNLDGKAEITINGGEAKVFISQSDIWKFQITNS